MTESNREPAGGREELSAGSLFLNQDLVPTPRIPNPQLINRIVVCYLSGVSTEELLAQVLNLPRDERVRVAGEILSTLEEPEDAVADAWSDELERRSREIAEGRVQPVDWDTAHAEILQDLERRRAGRTTS